ncbi:MAG: hypothetical protein OEL54_04870 [Flavobacteriaceae bacterium]|nr:hypothetical protein [Flavobacteriaceae bacterium]
MKNKLPSKFSKFTIIILLISLIFSTYSCKSYYQVDTENKPSTERLDELENKGKYLIIHDNSSAYKLTNFKIIDNQLTGVADILPKFRHNYMVTYSEKKNPYESKNKEVLNEVHIYTTQFIELNKNIEIPINSITRIEIYNKNKNATTKSHILGGLGIFGGVYALALAAGLIIILVAFGGR